MTETATEVAITPPPPPPLCADYKVLSGCIFLVPHNSLAQMERNHMSSQNWNEGAPREEGDYLVRRGNHDLLGLLCIRNMTQERSPSRDFAWRYWAEDLAYGRNATIYGRICHRTQFVLSIAKDGTVEPLPEWPADWTWQRVSGD